VIWDDDKNGRVRNNRGKMTKNEKRDYDFYINYPRDDCFLYNSKECSLDHKAPSPQEVFVQIDKYGLKPPYQCNDPSELERVLQGKRLVNFDIKQWVEGICEGTFAIMEIQHHVMKYPRWVWKSVLGGIRQRAKRNNSSA